MNLITPGETTAAGISESELSAPIQDALAKKAFLPSEPFLAWGSVDADLMGKSHPDLGLEVIGPMRPDSRWQGKAEQGYDLTHFTVEWQAHQVVCPQGKLNTCWTPHLDAWGTRNICRKMLFAQSSPWRAPFSMYVLEKQDAFFCCGTFLFTSIQYMVCGVYHKEPLACGLTLVSTMNLHKQDAF